LDKKEEIDFEEIEKNIRKSLLADMQKYLTEEARVQVIIAWELQRIADALEKIANCEHKGVFLVERPI